MGHPRLARISILALGLALTACAASQDSLRTGAVDPPPARTDALASRAPEPPPLVLVLDDLGFGATVVLDRLPSVRDLESLHYVSGLTRVVLQLPAWPAGWDRLEALARMPLPEDSEYLVIVPGYPPSRAAAEAWNQVGVRVRLIVVVPGPPADRAAILELNSIRALDRVVADMAEPSRAGFERLQRPLSFRVALR